MRASSIIFATAIATAGIVGAVGLNEECDVRSASSSGDVNIPDYLVIGAGAASIQAALFLLSSNRQDTNVTSTFKILEKTDTVGSFWTKFPRFDELISINKSIRNATQRFRYDWHSFLDADLGMQDVTSDYFPKGSDWHRYMNRVVRETPGLGENIEYGVEVTDIIGAKNDGDMPCLMLSTGERRCARRRIFVGTGLRTRDEPYLRAMGGIPYAEATKAQALNKRVCILGNGNSAFEIAQNIYGIADRVTLYGRSPQRLSSVTRYTGDVRVKYLQVLENLNGKLLDTVGHFTSLPRINGLERLPLDPSQRQELKELVRVAAWLEQMKCEVFFYATGVESVVPGRDMRSATQGHFPPTKDWYEDASNNKVHYLGWLMHERDFRKGAGGFFSGFRYLIRNLIRHVMEEDFDIEYPFRVFKTKEEVTRHVVARVQIADDLIILQDGRVLRDAVLTFQDEDGSTFYRYYEGVTFAFHDDLNIREEEVIYIYMAWGNGKTSGHVFDGVIRYADTGTLINMFLHPVIQVGDLSRDIHEDLEMAWRDPAYVLSIETVIKEALEGRMDKFFNEHSTSIKWQRSVFNQTEDPDYYEAAPLQSKMDMKVFQPLWKMVYTNGAEQYINNLTALFKEWQPSLFDRV